MFVTVLFVRNWNLMLIFRRKKQKNELEGYKLKKNQKLFESVIANVCVCVCLRVTIAENNEKNPYIFMLEIACLHIDFNNQMESKIE